MMPRVRPRTSRLPVADLSQPPSWADTERGKMRRSSITISPITSSATLREHWNAALARRQQIDLVGADAEAADGEKLVGRFQDLIGDLGARADAEQRHALERPPQILAVQRFGQALDIGETRRSEQVHGAVIDAFEQQRLRAPLRASAWD